MILASSFHSPVLLSQAIGGLAVTRGSKYIDATIGGGGHTDEILELGGIVLGIDRDQDAIDYVREKVKSQSASWRTKIKIGKNLFLEHGNFADLKKIADKFGFKEVSGIVFDLGMSTYQLEKSGRGFSWTRDEPLDMRMDVTSITTAADIINTSSKEELYEIFSKYSEELHSGPISGAIFRARTLDGQINGTKQLVAIIEKVLRNIYPDKLPFEFDKIRSSVLSRIFQALRIEVNNEIENIKKGLEQAIELLNTHGRLAVLSFHSLEDRIVKIKFKKAKLQGKVILITKQPIVAAQHEISANYRSRSAKLRIVEKI